MANRDVAIRLSVKDAGLVKAALRDVGDDGKRALERIERAGAPASRGLRVVNAAALEADRGIGQLSARAGGLATVARAIGPIGIALGVVAGGAVLVGAAARNAASDIAEIGDAADRAGVAVDLFEGLKASLTLSGQEANLEAGVAALNRKIGEARAGVDEAAKTFRALKVDVTSTEGRLKSTTDVVFELADAFESVKDPSQRAALGQKLMEESGRALVTVLQNGSQALRDQFSEAQKLGLLFGGDVIRSAQAVNAEFGVQAQILEVQLKSALLVVAPLVRDLTQAFVEQLPVILTTVSRIATAIGLLEELPLEVRIADKRVELDSTLKRIERINQELENSRSLQEGGVPQPLLALESSGTGGELGIANALATRQRAELDALLDQQKAQSDALKDFVASLGQGGGDINLGSGGSKTNGFESAVESIVRQTQQLEVQAQTIGLTAAEAARLRTETLLLAAAEKEYGDELQTNERLRGEVNLRIAAAAEINARAAAELDRLQEREKRWADATRERARAQEEAARRTEQSIERVGQTIEDVILDQENALKRVIALLIQAALGTGPLGGLVNGFLNVSSGGLISAIFGANSTLAPATSPVPIPRPAGIGGRAFGGEFTVPGTGGVDSVLVPMTPGERVNVTPGSVDGGSSITPSIEQTFHFAIAGGDEAGVEAALQRAMPVFLRESQRATLTTLQKMNTGARGTAGRAIMGRA